MRNPFTARRDQGGAFSSADVSNPETEADAKRRAMPWQDRAYAYYDALGEIKYSAGFYAKILGRLELVVQELVIPVPETKGSETAGSPSDTDEPLDPEWQPTKNPEALDALARVRDTKGGREHLQARYGQLKFLVGECYLTVTWPASGVENWEVLSTSEIKKVSDGWERNYDGGGSNRKTFRDVQAGTVGTEGEIQVYRLWTAHPRFSHLADAPMQGILDQCEELILLDRAVRGRTRSRIAGAGILLIPNEVSQPPRINADGSPAKSDPFMSKLTTTIVTPLKNEGSASSVVPVIIRGPAEALKELRHVDLGSHEKSTPEVQLRDKCVERIALGLDFPPEVLLGYTDANHWTAWQIDDNSWSVHGEPVAIEMVNDFTSSFFRPILIAAGLDPDKFRIWFDAAAVVNHPDRAADADKGYALGVLSENAWIEAHGFDSDSKPQLAELFRRIAFRWGDYGVLETGKPADSTGPLGRGPGLNPQSTAPGSDTGVSPPPDTPPAGGQASTRPPLDTSLVAAAELMVTRARQQAGSRLRTHLRKAKQDMPWKDTENINLCAAYCCGGGNIDSAALVRGASSEFLGTMTERLNIPAPIAEQVAEVTEWWAASTLCQPDPGPLPAEVMSRIDVASLLIGEP